MSEANGCNAEEEQLAINTVATAIVRTAEVLSSQLTQNRLL
jgi:hypothetical protein